MITYYLLYMLIILQPIFRKNIIYALPYPTQGKRHVKVLNVTPDLAKMCFQYLFYKTFDLHVSCTFSLILLMSIWSNLFHLHLVLYMVFKFALNAKVGMHKSTASQGNNVKVFSLSPVPTCSVKYSSKQSKSQEKW